MANTKVTGDLIAGGTITTFNLDDGSVTAAKLNSITTDNISEGTNLFYTDARVGTYLSGNGYDTATNIIATITDSAPTTLDTLNELAAALGDDPNFATTVTNALATKVDGAGTANYITKWSDSNTLTNSVIFDNSVNVGIGTTSPTDFTIFGFGPNIESSGAAGGGFISSDGTSTYKMIMSVDSSKAAGLLKTLTNHPLIFATNDTEKMRINADGSVGIGTTLPASAGSGRLALHLNSANGSGITFSKTGQANSYIYTAEADGEALAYYTDGEHLFYTTGTERMRITSGGNVGIGTTNPQVEFHIKGNDGLAIEDDGTTNWFRIQTPNAGGAAFYTGTVGTSNLKTIITSAGYFKITQDGTLYSLSGGYHEITKNGAGTTLVVANKGSSSMGLYYAEFTNAAPNSSSSTFFYGRDSIGPKIIIESSGNIVNSNNSYGPLSDIKLKENIVDTTPKLDKLMDVRIVNYNLIGDDLKQIGVVAQELEQVFPGLVSEHPDYEKVTTVDEEGNESIENVETGETTKSVKMSVFVPMLIKAMQELKQIVDNQQQQINDLKAQITK